MTSRLRPLDVELAFEDRPYKLGDTVRLTVVLNPSHDVDVREGRVDLACQQRYTQTSTAMVSDARLAGRAMSPMPQSFARKQVTTQRQETYVHSSVQFLKDARLDSGRSHTFEARLEINPKPPPGAAEATMKWSLVASVDVVRGRDSKTRRALQVILGSPTLSGKAGSVGARRLSKPKARTGPSRRADRS